MYRCLLYILLLVLTVLILGDMEAPRVAILVPSAADSASYDLAKLIIASGAKSDSSGLLVSTQWEKHRSFSLKTDSLRVNFPKEFYKIIPPQVTFEVFSYRFKYFRGYAKAESLTFAYKDTVTIRNLWAQPQFSQFMQAAQKTLEALEVVVDVRGWMDTTYMTTFDDPVNDTRSLYKLPVKLIPGENTIYFSPAGEKKDAVAFRTTTVLESKATSDRSYLFHNSTFEQNCSTCHEGLPSADSGASMKADCKVCHKEMSLASNLHAPVEMKECESCHSWSVDKHAVVLEKGVPGTCYDCHADKQAKVDSSATQHPVASECLTCHSPHGTEQNHILRTDTYSLCTSCHEDQKMNHPVGRHPLRYTKLKNGEEISCTSCHDPHGSENQHLLLAAGGPMVICAKCH